MVRLQYEIKFIPQSISVPSMTKYFSPTKPVLRATDEIQEWNMPLQTSLNVFHLLEKLCEYSPILCFKTIVEHFRKYT